jgi:hypothetical protein
MSSDPIVHTAYGPYRTLSSRLPEFLAKYPPSEGYGVEISIKDTLCLTPDLRSFYELAIKSGQNIESVGLPSLKVKYRSIIVEASLVRSGARLAVAHTFAQIEFDKDFEMAETRARQRLLAALGFDGKVLDDDELPSIAAADRTSTPTPAPETSISAEAEKDAVDAKSEPLQEPAEHPVVTSIDAAKLPAHVSAQVRMRIELLTKAGVAVEEPKSLKEARDILRMPIPNANGVQS